MPIRIELDIDVENPEEVIKTHKGSLMGFLSGVVMSKEAKRKKVNRAVAEEIVTIVKERLPIELAKEMVRASVEVRIVEDINKANQTYEEE